MDIIQYNIIIDIHCIIIYCIIKMRSFPIFIFIFTLDLDFMLIK